MLNNYLRYDVYKALRSGVVNSGSYERYALDNGVIAELYLLSIQMPKLITFTTDGTAVWNVTFDVEKSNPKFLSDFASNVYAIVTDTTSENSYVMKYVEEMQELLDKLLQNDSDESRRYFTIMYSNRRIDYDNPPKKVIEAINYYTGGFITSACKLLYEFFDIVREENRIGSGVSHTSAVLQVLRKSKPFLKVYNNIGPRYIISVADRDPEASEEFRTLLKEATHTSDDCIISLQGELKELKNNYGVLADSNSNNRYSTIIRNADTGSAYLVSVGWPEDL